MDRYPCRFGLRFQLGAPGWPKSTGPATRKRSSFETVAAWNKVMNFNRFDLSSDMKAVTFTNWSGLWVRRFFMPVTIVVHASLKQWWN